MDKVVNMSVSILMLFLFCFFFIPFLLHYNLHPKTQHTKSGSPTFEPNSIAYTKWVPYLLDPRFNTSAAFAGINTLGPSYTRIMFEESLVINVMAACLIGLAMVMPVLVMNPNFRFRPQRIITVTHDRYE